MIAARLAACRSCGAVQAMGSSADATVADCRTCGSTIERSVGRSLDAALACSLATFVLLVPANLLVIMETSLIGTSRQDYLWSSATVIWDEGWPWLALVIAVTIIVMPLVRFFLLSAVLITIRLNLAWRGVGRAFRIAQAVQPWAMVDVLLLGLWIAHSRLDATMGVHLGPGGICLVLAGLLTMFTRAVLPEAQVWDSIAADWNVDGPALACDACGFLVRAADEGIGCPRCSARITARRPGALERPAALTLAGLSLYVLANIYPMATVPMGLQAHKYTVLEGVGDLFKARLLALALLVLTVSFVIPLFKLLGLSWCVASAATRSGTRLRAKTRTFHIIEEIGRWSMTDPFAIACFVPLIQYDALVYGRAEAGASIFSFVVVSTMLAAHRFDPRLMWDAAKA